MNLSLDEYPCFKFMWKELRRAKSLDEPCGENPGFSRYWILTDVLLLKQTFSHPLHRPYFCGGFPLRWNTPLPCSCFPLRLLLLQPTFSLPLCRPCFCGYFLLRQNTHQPDVYWAIMYSLCFILQVVWLFFPSQTFPNLTKFIKKRYS